MAKGESSLEKHNINISHQVWGALKVNAFHERSSASDIVNFLVENFLKNPSKTDKEIGHRSHEKDEDRKGRSIYFRPDLWDQLREMAERENFSIASVIENMLADYLGLTVNDEVKEPMKDLDPNRYVKVGDDIFDLGENPKIIDANTGQPKGSE